MGVVFHLWYPGALSDLQGVDRLLLIMIGVDVVLGPLITLIVFEPGKKGLGFDLMVIASLQTTALLYGMGTIFNGRPAYVVYNVDRYSVIAVQDVDRDSLEKARARGEPGISWFGPRTTAAQLPKDPEARDALLFSSVSGGADLAQLPEWYVPLAAEHESMRERIRPLDELQRINELDATAWNALLKDFGKPEAELGYFPVDANERDGAMIVDRSTLAPLGLRLLTPAWGAPIKPATEEPPEPPRAPQSGSRQQLG